MAIIDKTIFLTFCPLCRAAKESEVYMSGADNERGPKFYCGTVIQPFQRVIKVQGEKCRVLQRMRSPEAVVEAARFLTPGKILL